METLRIAVVSDIHGNLPALEAVAADIGRRGVDLVVDCGDLISGPLWPAETAEWLMAHDWPTIRGNHERQLLAQRPGVDAWSADRVGAAARAWIAALPAALEPVEGVAMVHGRPGDDLEYLLETVAPDAGAPGARAATAAELASRLADLTPMPRLLLCGHSHMPRVAGDAACLVVNPGSVGVPAFDDDHGGLHVIETGSPHARWALCERRGGRWSVALAAVDYDWDAAARRARDNGFDDWARWIASGRAS